MSHTFYLFKSSLHPTWSSNSPLLDQESHIFQLSQLGIPKLFLTVLFPPCSCEHFMQNYLSCYKSHPMGSLKTGRVWLILNSQDPSQGLVQMKCSINCPPSPCIFGISLPVYLFPSVPMHTQCLPVLQKVLPWFSRQLWLFPSLFPKVLKELPTFAAPTSSFVFQTLTSFYLVYALKHDRYDLEDFTNNLNPESNCNIYVLILNDPSDIFWKIELKEYLCMVQEFST